MEVIVNINEVFIIDTACCAAVRNCHPKKRKVYMTMVATNSDF